MYGKSAQFYDQLYAFKDYKAAAAQLHTRINRTAPHAKSLLDVACGTGRHLEFLREHYRVEGVDINPDLLARARARCLDVPFHCLDMTAFDLQRSFDVVSCLFSAIAYVRTPESLRKTVVCLARHLAPGGVLFLEPYFTPEQYWVDKVTLNTVVEPSCKIAWMYVSRREGNLGIQDVHYLVGTPEGIQSFSERHELGLFTESEYQNAFADAGLTTTFDETGLFGRGMYVAQAAASSAGPAATR
jgi:SAM-dependent methyltransferase